MIKKMLILIVIIGFIATVPAAAEHHSAFDKMKQMVGAWEGKLTRVTGEKWLIRARSSA